jgi:hypothetical protein
MPIGQGAAQVFDIKDPGEMLREHYTGGKTRQAELAKLRQDQAKYGEGPFDVEEVVRWEDKRGYEELVGAEKQLRDVWNQAYRSGYNIRNPRTADDARLAKVYYDKFREFKETSDLYRTQGERLKKAMAAREGLKPEEFDEAATMENIQRFIDAPTVRERAAMMDRLIARKDKPFDSLKYVTEMIPKAASVQRYITSEDIDEETGKIRKSTWEGIPEAARKDAIREMYNSGDPKFQEKVNELRRANPTMDDPNWSGADFAAEYYGKIREGAKEDVIYYGTGTGADKRSLGIAPGAGKPEQDPDGNYKTNEDTIHLYNSNTKTKSPHTAPYQVNMTSDEMFGKKSAHMQITVSDQVINSETGEKEAVGSQALFRPSKVVWLPVVEGSPEGKAPWGKMMDAVSSLWNPNQYPPGTILSDDDLAAVEGDMATGKAKAGYVMRPYVIGQLGYERKEGQIDDDERILNLNRSVMVPYEDVSDDLSGRFGKRWAPAVGDDVANITRDLNFGGGSSGGPGKSYQDLGL